MTLNTVRHDTIYSDAKDGMPILIIGMGATGSFVFSQLVSMGVQNIICIDPDRVESHNLANQIYTHSDVGEYKVYAARNWAKNKLGEIPSSFDFLVGTAPEQLPVSFTGVVFLLTDTMDSRRSIVEAICDNPEYIITRMIETRMGAMQGEIFSFSLDDPYKREAWESTLFSDDEDETEVSPCGAPITVGPTASILASLAVWDYINYTTNEEACNENTHFFTRPFSMSNTHRI